MVQALVTLSDEANRVLNVVKAKYGLRTKSDALERLVVEYAAQLLEPELRPAFVRQIRRRGKERSIPVDSFRERYGLE